MHLLESKCVDSRLKKGGEFSSVEWASAMLHSTRLQNQDVVKKSLKINIDIFHPGHYLFDLLPNRLKNVFYPSDTS